MPLKRDLRSLPGTLAIVGMIIVGIYWNRLAAWARSHNPRVN